MRASDTCCYDELSEWFSKEGKRVGIELLTGKTIMVPLDDDMKVDLLEYRIRWIQGQRLPLGLHFRLRGEQLSPWRTLGSYNIQPSDLLVTQHGALLKRNEGDKLVDVRDLNGGRITVGVEPFTVDRLEQMVEMGTGVPPSMQLLLFNGRQLERGRDLGSYGIVEYSLVHMAARMCGGREEVRVLENQFKELIAENRVDRRFNKLYKEGATSEEALRDGGEGTLIAFWRGRLNDGIVRGGEPYYCPQGFLRIALKSTHHPVSCTALTIGMPSGLRMRGDPFSVSWSAA